MPLILTTAVLYTLAHRLIIVVTFATTATLRHMLFGVTRDGNVSVGTGLVITNGVQIGENAVTGACVIITRDIAAGARTITPISKDIS